MVGDFFFILFIFFFFLWFFFFFKKKSPFSTLSSRCASVGKPLWRPIRVLERVPEYIHPMHEEKRRGGKSMEWRNKEGDRERGMYLYSSVVLQYRPISQRHSRHFPSLLIPERNPKRQYIYIYILGGIAIEPKRYDYSILVSPTVFWLRPPKKSVFYTFPYQRKRNI